MRIAVVSDIHGNLTALEAVIADLREAGAEFVVQGGDLVGGGPRPVEVIDRIRELGWEVMDAPGGTTLRPALPTQAEAGVGYARQEDLASLLDEPATVDASLVALELVGPRIRWVIPQPRDRLTTEQVTLDDLFRVVGRQRGVPNPLWVDHRHRSVAALAEAA